MIGSPPRDPGDEGGGDAGSLRGLRGGALPVRSLTRLAASLAIAVVVTGCPRLSNVSSKPAKVTQAPAKAREMPPIVKKAKEHYEKREYEKVIFLLEGSIQDKKSTPEHFYFLAMAYMNTAQLPECEQTLKRAEQRFSGLHLIREGMAQYRYVIGRLRLEEGDLEAANEAFEQGLAQAKGDAGYQEKVATGYREGARRLADQKKRDLAVKALEHGLALFPDNQALTAELARLQGRPPQPSAPPAAPSPLPSAAGSPSASPGSPAPPASAAALPGGAPAGTPIADLARQALDARNSKRAEELALQALATAPGDREATLVLARALDRQGRAKDGLAPCESYLEAHPGDALVMVELARLRLSLGDPKGAERLTDQVIASKQVGTDELLQAMNWKAMARLQSKDQKGAVALLEQIIDRSPEHAPSLFLLGQVQESKGDLKQAIALYERAMRSGRKDPETLRYLFRLALAYRQTGQEERANAALRAIVADDPTGPWGRKAGQVLATAPEPAASQAPAGAGSPAAPSGATSVKPDQATEADAYLLSQGRASLARNAPAEAATFFQKALGTWPASVDARLGLVESLALLGLAREAEEAAAQLATDEQRARAKELRARPGSPGGESRLVELAEAYRKARLYGPAVAMYERARGAVGTNAAHLIGYGEALERSGKKEEARAAYQEAARLAPDSEEVHLKMGVSCFHAKQLPEAIDHFRKALEINPRNAKTYFDLADILHSLKEFQTEREVFDKLIEQNISPKANQQAQLMLRRLPR